MLEKDPEKRASIGEVLAHPWVDDAGHRQSAKRPIPTPGSSVFSFNESNTYSTDKSGHGDSKFNDKGKWEKTDSNLDQLGCQSGPVDMGYLVHLILQRKQKRSNSRNMLSSLLQPGKTRLASTSAKRTCYKVLGKK